MKRMTPMRLAIIAHPCGVACFSCCSSCFKTMPSFAKQEALLSSTVAWSFETSPSWPWRISCLHSRSLGRVGNPWFSGRALLLPGCEPGSAHGFHSLMTRDECVTESQSTGEVGGGGWWPCGAYTEITPGVERPRKIVPSHSKSEHG